MDTLLCEDRFRAGLSRFWGFAIQLEVYGAVIMFLFNFSRFFRQWRAYDVNLCRLSRLDDRGLALIGVDRLDIARVAWERAQRMT